MPDAHADSSAEALLERQRIARDLHDTVAQSLVALGFGLDQLIGEESLAEQHRKEIRAHRLELSQIVEDLRSQIHRLRDNPEDSLVDWLAKRSPVEVDCDITETKIPFQRELAHLILELLTNSHKHQGVSRAQLRARENQLEIDFTESQSKAIPNCDEGADHSNGGQGQQGVNERLEILGLSLDHRAHGFTLKGNFKYE